MGKFYYSMEHEWIKVEGESGIVGITDYAQEQLSDVVFVEVTKLNHQVDKNEEVAVIESVKAASEIYSPVSGSIVAANETLETKPEKINSDCMGAGWIFEIRLSDLKELDGLMDWESYMSFVEGS